MRKSKAKGNGFWNFPPHVKYDEITEGHNDHLFYGAVADMETGVDKVNRDTYIVYGNIEALLFRPTNTVYRLGIELLKAFLQIQQ